MITPEEQPNQYVESLNYLILLTQDYVNTLPDSSKIAVIAQANKALKRQGCRDPTVPVAAAEGPVANRFMNVVDLFPQTMI